MFPAAERDKLVALNSYNSSESDKWNLRETLVHEVINDCMVTEDYHLSMTLSCDHNRSAEFDFGAGAYRRPGQPGAFVFGLDGVAQGRGPFHSINFSISRKLFSECAEQLLQRPMPSIEKLHSRAFLDTGMMVYLKMFLNECQRHPPNAKHENPDLFLPHIERIVGRLLRLSGNSIPELSDDDQLQTTGVRSVIDYMQAHLGDELRRDELAKIAGVTPHYFTRLFQRATGETPRRYLLGIRIERAQELLSKNPELSIASISERLGFHSSSHFTSEFRKQTGITPEVFRRYS